MDPVARAVALLSVAETPGPVTQAPGLVAQTTPGPVGPSELSDLVPILLRAAWFCAAFLVVVVLGVFVVEPFVSRIVGHRNPDNPTIQEAISRYVRLVMLVVAVFVGASVAGYGRFVGNSAIVIAAATLAIGVAGQAVIGSLVSGMALVFDPEFNVGNYIEWSEGEGVVESITLRVTRVRTSDDKLVTIPNEKLTQDAVARPYGHQRFRVVDRVGISYADDVEAALGHLEAAARDIEGVRAEPQPAAYVDEFGGDSVLLRVHYWIDDPRQRDIFAIRSAYAREVKTRLEEDGITISPPAKRELEGRIAVDGEAG